MLTNISLTKKEDKLISLLLEFSEAINQGQESKLAIRIVGGWVRDKLLNRESDDIDLMITKMRALEFIKALSIYLKNKQIDITFGIIKSNENKLKLIESANFTIDNLKVDVIDLFNYLEPTDDKSTVCDSLIYEDTMRRDITINSLYYNIHTKQIEDFTNMGINDLNNKIIRTCRQAKYFFLKDPFSLLRSIRFSTILQFKLDDDIIEAAKAEQVKVILIH
ncbi:Nucleotidyltransferase [Neoconidiobolus thromboides FSU 785]|nr:Nucleotidyltransferase [Neoconidiobolus thromboides FSU 785]